MRPREYQTSLQMGSFLQNKMPEARGTRDFFQKNRRKGMVWRVLGPFLILFLPFLALAEAAPACLPPVENTKSLKDRACEIERKLLNCDKFAAENPEAQDFLWHCPYNPQEKIPARQGQWLCKNALGLALKQSIVDPFVLLSENLVGQVKDTEKFLLACRDQAGCREDLFRETHGRDPSDAEAQRLKQMNSVRELDVLWRNALSVHNSTFKQNQRDQEQQNLQKKPDGDLESEKSSGLWMAALGTANLAKNEVNLYLCAKPEFQAWMMCFAGATMAGEGALLATGIVKAPASVQKLYRIFNQGRMATGAEAAAEAAQVAKLSGRDIFINQHMGEIFTTEEQNRKWMGLAEKTTAQKNIVFADFENSKMKFLNDSLKDKDLVTAVTNRHKEILFDKIHVLEKEFPQLEIIPYSDFKSTRLAFKGEIPANFKGRLDAVFKEANQEFKDDLIKSKILRKEDLSENWFRGGLGETADEANMATRYSRNSAGENRLRGFDDPIVQEDLQTHVKTVEMYRQEVQSELGSSGLLEKVDSSERMIPKREIIELARKEKDPAQCQSALSQRYGTTVTPGQAEKLKDYLDYVDEFSPGIHVAKRETPSLSGGAGGLSADFAGMGSYNAQATAAALAKSSDLKTAIQTSRQGEQKVTAFFQQRVRDRQAIVENYVQDKKGISVKMNCSGDDCVAVTSKGMTSKMREELVQRLSRTDDPSGMRISMVSDKVRTETDRNLLAAHGEAAEKLVRRQLAGKIPEAQLKNVTFAVEMNGAQAGKGDVRLLIGNSRTALSAEQNALIQSEFKKAVNLLNDDLKKNTLNAEYFVKP